MPRYTIRTIEDSTGVSSVPLHRRAFPDAFLAFERACYDTLASFALLDRPIAWRNRHQCAALYAAPEMKPGEQYACPIANTGYTVTIQRN